MKREIEIKYLLNGKTGKNELIAALERVFPTHQKKATKTVISYFYKDGVSHEQILTVGKNLLMPEEYIELQSVLNNSDALLVKARSIDDTVYFAVKGSAKGDDPVHAVNRIEFEAEVHVSLEDVGNIIEDAGIEIASKWSSRREFYTLENNIEMNLEFVAGYGYKAEIEIVINDGDSHEDAIKSIETIAGSLHLTEASQELFGRMYAYYNEHWQEYFNTDREFPASVWQELGRT